MKKRDAIYTDRDYLDAQFTAIHDKLDKIEKHDERISSLEHTRTRAIGWVAGISVGGGTFGAWLHKAIPALFS